MIQQHKTYVVLKIIAFGSIHKDSVNRHFVVSKLKIMLILVGGLAFQEPISKPTSPFEKKSDSCDIGIIIGEKDPQTSKNSLFLYVRLRQRPRQQRSFEFLMHKLSKIS